MGAYWRPIQTKCGALGCASRAVGEVFNTFNASQGKFCRFHAEPRVKELQAGEKDLGRAMGWPERKDSADA